MRALLERAVAAQLRRDIRRVEWLGSLPKIPEDRPVVIYSNHQAFYDGLVLGYLARFVLGRRPCVWMEEFQALPAAGWLGALPFPPEDRDRRARSIRRAVERMRSDAGTAFIYFPEGRLHPFDEDLLDFPADALTRLGRVFPPSYWWPVGVRVWTWNTVRPVATLVGGAVEDRPPDDPRARLEDLTSELVGIGSSSHGEPARTTLLEGRRGPDERWAWVGRLFPAGTA